MKTVVFCSKIEDNQKLLDYNYVRAKKKLNNKKYSIFSTFLRERFDVSTKEANFNNLPTLLSQGSSCTTLCINYIVHN